ncbi:MAG TPA: hypothetical protein VM118_11345 [Acidobacteriota bacterium]|nr:hypothetical protein [Acidobacteriota bacterium]
MLRRVATTGAALLVAVSVASLSGCSSDGSGGGTTYKYRLTLTAPETTAIGGIIFAFEDDANRVQEDRLKLIYACDGFPVWKCTAEGSPPTWRVVLLQKRGTTALGEELFEITTDEALNIDYIVVEQVCDTTGTAIDAEDVIMAIEPVS